MPVGKSIHNMFSKKLADKKAREESVARKAATEGPPQPPKIDQWKKNMVTRGNSNNVHITQLAGINRNVSKNEGKPAVNGKVGEKVEQLIHKPPLKNKKVDATAGAITTPPPKKSAPGKTKKPKGRCGNCGETGHNKRTCPDV